MSEKKPKNIFQEGPIPPLFIAEQIQKHSTRTNIGAHQIFLGQVRADQRDGKTVVAIEYSAYEAMALKMAHDLREAILTKYPLACLHIYHSLGSVKAGEISLFVFVSSAHRRAAIDACAELVERIKAELPVWGKEIFDNNEYQWKINN